MSNKNLSITSLNVLHSDTCINKKTKTSTGPKACRNVVIINKYMMKPTKLFVFLLKPFCFRRWTYCSSSYTTNNKLSTIWVVYAWSR